MTLSTSGAVWAEGKDIFVGSGGNLKYSSMKKGIYEFDWQLQTPDQGDYLNLNVEKGKVFVNYDGDATTGRWFEVAPGTSFAIAPGQQYLSKLLVKVEGRTNGTWNFSTYDSFNNYPYDDAPTNPKARFVGARPEGDDQMVDYVDIDPISRETQTFFNGVGKKDPDDRYRFEASDQTMITGNLTAFHNESNLQLWKWVDGVNDQLLTESKMKGDQDIINWNIDEGQYYFKVSTAAKTKDTSYKLDVFASPPGSAPLEPEKDMGDREFSATNLGTVVSKSSNGTVTYKGGSLEENQWTKYDSKSEAGKHIDIIEYIGGDDVSDFAKFTIQAATRFEIKNENVLFAVLNSKADNRIISSESYSSNLTVDLQPGTYYLQYNHEGSIPEVFTSRITMSAI